MEEIVSKNLCSGCHACFNACPVRCIKMQTDDEGFLYPLIDTEKCIDCSKCKKICPVLNDYTGNPKEQAFACINKDEEIRMNSSSGGIFSLLAETVIASGGVVFGAAFDNDLNVQHICVDNKDELYKLRGSKYLQSTIGNSYQEAEKYLKNEQTVLFSGTPCQISGLKSYLGVDYPNLVTQDIICHGVPSPFVWQKYLDYLQDKFKSAVNKKDAPVFRNKTTGWKQYSVKINFKNKPSYEKKSYEDLYMKAFLKNLSLRESCYNCHSKSITRQSDITLGDFWGVEKICPEMDDNKGISLVLINSEKGEAFFNKIKENIIYKKTDIDKSIQFNQSAIISSKKPDNRTHFITDLDKYNFKKAVNKGIDEKFYNKLITKFKRIIKGVIKHVQK